MKVLEIIIFIVLMPLFGFSQDFRPGNPQYKAETDLFVLRFVPGDKKAKIFIAGTKRADIDLNKDAKVVSVIMKNDQRQEVLSVSGSGNAYEVESSNPFPKNYQVIVKTRVQGKVQELKLNVDSSKP